jgi:glycosyltransferase involved in cell wall biosynthesis
MKKKIVCLYKGGRKDRLSLIPKGLVPFDFFYGALGLNKKEFEISFFENKSNISGFKNKIFRLKDLFIQRLTKLGIGKFDVNKIKNKCLNKKIIISFSDGLSLSLGCINYLQNIRKIGCFHCLSDLDQRSHFILRKWSYNVIKKSIDNLDHIAFFGEEDRKISINKFNIIKKKTSIIRFGVDTNFWKPANGNNNKYFFSVGQDPQRDFNTLIKANVDYPIHIHTELNIKSSKKNIMITSGSFFNRRLSDVELRELYQNSIAVIVPLKDVVQPSGYSVTLQAMSCGKPVILTKTKGLWDKNLLIDKFNCILIDPYNSDSLTKAMNKITDDQDFRKELGFRARETVEKYFNMEVATTSLADIINEQSY